MRNVGRRVAELRAKRGLTQQKFAEVLDVRLRRVTDIERGRANLTLKALSQLAGVLKVLPAEFFSLPTTKPRPGRPPGSRANPGP